MGEQLELVATSHGAGAKLGDCAAPISAARDDLAARTQTTAAHDSAPAATKRATVRRGGKTAAVDGAVLYTEGGLGAEDVLQRVVALLNDETIEASDSPHARCALIVSAGGGRLDHPALGLSLRARGGPARLTRALIAEIAQRWNAEVAEAGEVTTTPANTPALAHSCDQLRLHRYHLEPRGTTVALDHDGLQLAAAVSATTTEQARAFAWRIAQTWNMAEGWSASVAEAGVLSDLDLALWALVEAYEKDLDYSACMAEVATLLRRRDSMADRSGGRAHDCARCLAGEARGSDFSPEGTELCG